MVTTRVLSVRMPEPVLSNTWWPFALDGEGRNLEDADRIVALWLNSTLGILTLVVARVDTRGSWIELKKPILEQLDVLDPHVLRARHKEKDSWQRSINYQNSGSLLVL